TSRWSNATYALCVHGQVTTIELNEPVAPEFRNILPDELFQTVEKLFRSSRHVFSHATLSTCQIVPNCREIVPILETCLFTCHAFDMPRLLNQRELLGSARTWANHVFDIRSRVPRCLAKEAMMRVLMLPAAAAILLIGADLLCAPAVNAQVQ